MKNRSWILGPKTKKGNWSFGLIIAMFILFILGSSLTDTLYESVSSGDTILADISVRPALALSMLAGMFAGIMALVTGLIAIRRDKERAVLVYISTFLGACLTIFLIAEFLFPH